MKIATVNVWYWTISKAPYSASRPSVTSRQPPSTAGEIWRRVTRQNVRHGPSPRLRPTSSSAGSTPPSAAATGRYTSGYSDSVMISTAAEISVQPRLQRHPAEAHDEVGDAERQHERHRPPAAAGQRRALHAPGGRHADRRAQDRARERQAHGVPQQHRRLVAQQQTFDFSPARLQGLVDQEHQRQQHQSGGEQAAGDAHQRPAPPPRPRCAPSHSTWVRPKSARPARRGRACSLLLPTTDRASARVPAARGRCPGRRS